jgi:hypothetical protein
LSQIRKSYRNELQNTTTHCTRSLTVSESAEPKIWTIVQIFGLAKKRALKFPCLCSALQSFKKKSVRPLISTGASPQIFEEGNRRPAHKHIPNSCFPQKP